MSGRLTTHVLDTAIGFPAEGINIELYSIREEVRKFIKQLTTNPWDKIKEKQEDDEEKQDKFFRYPNE